MTTLLPPAKIKSGSPVRTVAIASAVSNALVSAPAGPPRRSVVRVRRELSLSGDAAIGCSALTSGTTFTLGSGPPAAHLRSAWKWENSDEQAARDEGLLAGGTARRR